MYTLGSSYLCGKVKPEELGVVKEHPLPCTPAALTGLPPVSSQQLPPVGTPLDSGQHLHTSNSPLSLLFLFLHHRSVPLSRHRRLTNQPALASESSPPLRLPNTRTLPRLHPNWNSSPFDFQKGRRLYTDPPPSPLPTPTLHHPAPPNSSHQNPFTDYLQPVATSPPPPLIATPSHLQRTPNNPYNNPPPIKPTIATNNTLEIDIRA
uniref:Uncharacterized protein n=1 Tax=Daucus carota subsp. sativus TaxID=79200 RepID=A0A161WVZ8_DAUCS